MHACTHVVWTTSIHVITYSTPLQLLRSRCLVLTTWQSVNDNCNNNYNNYIGATNYTWRTQINTIRTYCIEINIIYEKDSYVHDCTCMCIQGGFNLSSIRWWISGPTNNVANHLWDLWGSLFVDIIHCFLYHPEYLVISLTSVNNVPHSCWRTANLLTAGQGCRGESVRGETWEGWG